MDDAALERSAVGRIAWRLVPFLVVCYVVSFLDRVNVGFAALQMNQELGFSATVYGWGAGIFFLGYFLFEVPSNLALERFGARRWIARIMVSWGVLSAGMALTQGPLSFYALRFLLGAAEAGFFPGLILYFTYWFPAEHRARIVGLLMAAIPIASFVGSPLSAALLGLDWLGLHGWQWLFLLEGLPAVVLGILVLVLLPDRPADARWLPPAERAWLEGRLAAEARRNALRAAQPSVWEILRQPRVLLLSAVYFGTVASSYGLTLWTPQIIKAFGLTNMQTGLLNSVPYAFASVAMVWWGRRSDRARERRWHAFVPLVVLALGLLGGTVLTEMWPVVAALTVAVLGTYMGKGPFWALATETLPPATAAASIAAVNSMGNLAGFVGPFLIGAIRDQTGSFALCLVPLIVFALVAGGVVLGIGQRTPATLAAGAD